MGDSFSTSHVNDAMNKQVAEPVPVASPADIRKAIPVGNALRYVINDTYIADLTGILGRVYYEKVGSDRLVPFITSVAVTIDPNSKLSAPQTVAELIVDSKVKGKVEALSFLSADLDAEELLEVRVINNASARVVDRGEAWDQAVEAWLNKTRCQALIADASVGTISVVTGAVQKYFTTKKYKKFQAGARGGAWGVNVEGSLYTSTSQFEMQVVYGLDLVTFKQTDDVAAFARDLARGGIRLDDTKKLADVGRKFDRMALSLPSIFDIGEG